MLLNMKAILTLTAGILLASTALASDVETLLNPKETLGSASPSMEIGSVSEADKSAVTNAARKFVEALLNDDKPSLVQQLTPLPLTAPQRAIKVRGWSSTNPILNKHDATKLYVYPEQQAVVLAAFQGAAQVPLITFDSGSIQGMVFRRERSGLVLQGFIEE